VSKPRNSQLPMAQRGFTIVELMVAMTLALLIIAAVGALYVTTKQTFRVQDNASGMDEVLRAVEEDMSREIRKAGYFGCFRWKDKVTPPYALTAREPTAQNGKYTLPKDGTEVKLGAQYDVRGGTASSTTVSPVQSGVSIVAGSEFLSISYGQPLAYLATDLPTGIDPLVLNGPIDVKTGQPLLVSTCDGLTLMRSDTEGKVSTIAHNPAAGDNIVYGDPVMAYPRLLQGSTVMGFQSAVYFLGQQSGSPQSLYLLSPDNSTTPAQPLAANVEQLNFQYGIDMGGANLAYVSAGAIAATDWDKVRAVRVGLVVRSNDDSLSETAAGAGIGYTWDSANGRYTSSNTGTDRRLRKAHVFTVAIRGRTPAL